MLLANVLFLCQDGHILNVKYIRNCKKPKSIITVDKNVTIKMTKDCNLIVVGCLNTEGFATAKVSNFLS